MPGWSEIFELEMHRTQEILYGHITEAIPIKCFVSHRPVSCDSGSVGRAKKKITLERVWVPEKAGLLSNTIQYNAIQ